MSYQRGTTHFNLPQTIGTDKRDWSDTNQAFADVDAALYAAAEDASGAASAVTALDTRLTTQEGKMSTAVGDIAALQASDTTQDTTLLQHGQKIAALENKHVNLGEVVATSGETIGALFHRMRTTLLSNLDLNAYESLFVDITVNTGDILSYRVTLLTHGNILRCERVDASSTVCNIAYAEDDGTSAVLGFWMLAGSTPTHVDQTSSTNFIKIDVYGVIK